MQRKYYSYNAPVLPPPDAGVPMHGRKRENVPKERPDVMENERAEEKNKEKRTLPFVGGKGLLGRYEADDLMLLCIIFLLLLDADEPDIPLLLALGYIFLSDKEGFWPKRSGGR